MKLIALISFLCFTIYLFLGIQIYLYDRKALLNRLFLLISLSMAIWAFTYSFMLAAPDASTALFWRRISTIGWAFMYSFFLHFFLVLTSQRFLSEPKLALPIIYLPALIFLYIFTSQEWIDSLLVVNSTLGWVFIDPTGHWINIVFIAYYSIILLTAITLTWLWGKTSTLRRHKRQAKIIVITLSLAFVLGALTDGLLPYLRFESIPPLAIIIILIPMLGMWYAIKRYRFMAVNPKSFSHEILENMSEGLFMINQDGFVELANKSAEDILEYKLDTLKHLSMSDLIAYNGLDRKQSVYDYLKNLSKANKVVILKSATGKEIPVLLSASQINDVFGETFGTVCTFQDITERIDTQKELEKQRSNFEQLFNAAPIGIVLVTQNDQVIDCNEEFTRLFEYSKGEIIGGCINSFIVPSHLKLEASGLTRLISSGQVLYYETTRKSKSGKFIEVAITGTSIENGSEKNQIYVIYQDISERKRAEEVLQKRLLHERNAVRIISKFSITQDIDKAINESLAEIGELCNADRSYVFLFDNDPKYMSNTHEWCAPGISPEIANLQHLPVDSHPWWISELQESKEIIIEDIADMPPQASAEKELLESQKIKSVIVLPIFLENKLAGFIGFDYVKNSIDLSESNLVTLRITAEVIGHSIERKQFREALMHERDVLQALIDNIPDAIYFKDSDNKYLRINKAMAKLLDVKSTEEAVGKTNFEFPEKTQAQSDYELEQKLIREAKPIIRKLNQVEIDGAKRWMSSTIVPLQGQDNNITGLLGILHDLTEQKQIEEQLRSREKFLSNLNETTSLALKKLTTPDLIQLLAEQINKLLSSDVSFITQFNQPDDQVIPIAASGISPATLITLGVECGEKTFTHKILKTEKALINDDFTDIFISDSDASQQLPIGTTLGLPLIAYGHKLGAVFVGFKNYHQFTEDEIELGALAANQIALIIARTQMHEQLVKNDEELRKLNASKDKLFSVIAHDLRSPFTSFLGLTELMTDETSQMTLAEMQELANAIRESAQGLYQLLENLLEWASLQGRTIRFNPKKIDLGKTINSSMAMLETMSSQKGIEINNHVSLQLFVRADERMLRSVIGNLISNAIKFTKRGGKVTIDTHEPKDGWLQIDVRDTGVGMNREMTSKLFMLDGKITTPGTDGEPSSGLGLILCKEFVNQHGGTIWVESTPEKGSTFSFTLPVFAEN